MEKLKNVTHETTVAKISHYIAEIYTTICKNKEDNIPDSKIKEIDFLEKECNSEIVALRVISCHTLLKLIENKIIDGANILSTLLQVASNDNSFSNYSIIAETALNILLINLKHKTATLKGDTKYESPFTLKIPQHPLITLIKPNFTNMNDISHKINCILNHKESIIKKNCIEFLRPVFLYILCNPQTLPDSKAIWRMLLLESKSSAKAQDLVDEIFKWRKTSSSESCLFTSILLVETIDFFIHSEKFTEATGLIIYLACILNDLIDYGLDPKPSLNCIYENFRLIPDCEQFYNPLLIFCAKIMHKISPFQMTELIDLLYYIIITENYGTIYILNMILDATLQRVLNPGFINPKEIQKCYEIIDKIILKNKKNDNIKISSNVKQIISKYCDYHTDIAIVFDIVKLAESFMESDYMNIFIFIDKLQLRTELSFCSKIQFFLRAIFLSNELSVDCWFKIYQKILSIVKLDISFANSFINIFLYKLAYERHPETQLELLRGLPCFANSKENVPLILSTIKILAQGPNLPLCMDLYLRLWKVQERTYPFLQKILSETPNENVNKFEYNVTKASIIKEISMHSSQVADLVGHISNIFNTCTGEDGELPTSLAIDAITSLCESNDVNIISVWKVISVKFENEQRTKVIKSLYNFFAQIPLLPGCGKDYDNLLDEALKQLWQTISESNNIELIKVALNVLKNFKLGTQMRFDHIPFEYKLIRENEHHSCFNDIPGDTWIILLKKINKKCIQNAADLLSHYINDEIATYRSGVYRLPEGMQEPRKFNVLFKNSILKSVTHYLVNQASQNDISKEPLVIINALRAISKKFKNFIPPIDWTFLNVFLPLGFEARKYCIFIAKHQLEYSESAKDFLDRILNNFEPNCFEEDLLLLLNSLPELSNKISPHTLRLFMDNVTLFCYKESQLNGFPEGCLFEKLLDNIKNVFLSNCTNVDVLNHFSLIVERYMESIELDSRLFERYTEVVATLNQSTIESLTLPLWSDKPTEKLKKAAIIRFYLVLYNTQLENPLDWLEPIIDAFSENQSEAIFFFRHLAITLYAFNDDKNSCAWIMKLFLQIQTNLANANNQLKRQKACFLIDVLILSVDVLSGYAIILGNIDNVATSKQLRMQIFPQSLNLLCVDPYWNEEEYKIYETLFVLSRNFLIPNKYTNIFRTAVMYSRNHNYFDNRQVWKKYVGMRK